MDGLSEIHYSGRYGVERGERSTCSSYGSTYVSTLAFPCDDAENRSRSVEGQGRTHWSARTNGARCAWGFHGHGLRGAECQARWAVSVERASTSMTWLSGASVAWSASASAGLPPFGFCFSTLSASSPVSRLTVTMM